MFGLDGVSPHPVQGKGEPPQLFERSYVENLSACPRKHKVRQSKQTFSDPASQFHPPFCRFHLNKSRFHLNSTALSHCLVNNEPAPRCGSFTTAGGSSWNRIARINNE